MSINAVWGPPGSGKTTLSINLAQGISRTERTVCLISPAEYSEYSALFGKEIPAKNSLDEALRDPVRMNPLRVSDYLYVLAMPSGTDAFSSAFSDESVKRLLSCAEGAYDYVITDCLSQPSNLVSAWSLNRARHVMLCLGSCVASPMWMDAERKAIEAMMPKIVPVGCETAEDFDYNSMYMLEGMKPYAGLPYIRQAPAMTGDGRLLLNAGGSRGREYLNAVNRIYEVMQN